MYAHIEFANKAGTKVWASKPHVRITKINDIPGGLQLSSKEEAHWSSGNIDEWTSMRENEISIAMNAMHFGVKRSVKSLRAASLLHSIADVPVQKPNYEKVPDITRDEEIRGQSWAIIGLVGDAKYEIERRKILDELGSQFFEMIRSSTVGSTDYDEDALQLIFEHLQERESLLADFNEAYTKSAKQELDYLIQEPQIAVFAFGEDPDKLKEKAKDLSEEAKYKHVNIAVVRMYSWLNLTFVDNNNIEHTSRLSIADPFFKAMRQSSKNA